VRNRLEGDVPDNDVSQQSKEIVLEEVMHSAGAGAEMLQQHSSWLHGDVEEEDSHKAVSVHPGEEHLGLRLRGVRTFQLLTGTQSLFPD
jgi:hypothetical protein